MKRNNLREAAFSNDLQISSLFETNADIAIMRKPFTKAFSKNYNEGFQQYVKGNWDQAIEKFNKCLEIIPADVPIKRLKEFMSETSNVPPADWQGFKECRSE